MNKKLRLLVTEKCPNKCPLCCNRNIKMNDVPIVDRWDYDEIMITGGEPLLFHYRLLYILRSIQNITTVMGYAPKIYVYTSKCDVSSILSFIKLVDGIVLTPHTKDDISYFKQLNNEMLKNWWKFNDFGRNTDLSMRLNVLPEIKDFLPENLKRWKVKEIQWLENCPVPEGEDLRRVSNLWLEDAYNRDW